MDDRFPESDADRIAVRHLREHLPDLLVLYRFGSSVGGGEHGGSDLDYALLARARLESLARWELQEDLAVELRRDVDLIDLARAPTVLRMQVVSSGRVLFCADEDERARFEMYVYSSYARLNEERRGILERIAQEGRVLGS